MSLLTEDTEADLIKKLSELPNEIALSASEYAPQRLVQYARDLAAVFHSFYDAGNRTPSPARPSATTQKPLKPDWSWFTPHRLSCKNTLALLGLSAPERM